MLSKLSRTASFGSKLSSGCVLRTFPNKFSQSLIRTFIPSDVTTKNSHNAQPVNSGKNAILTLPDGKKFEFPILDATEGPSVIDIRKLYDATGMFTYDPGFTSTASCFSRITYIDGDKGILEHRGYNIADLVENSDFNEVSYLVLHGELPNEQQKKIHEENLKDRLLNEKLIKFYEGFKDGAPPMSVMVGVVGALSSFYSEKGMDISSAYVRNHAAYQIISKMPTMAAYAYKLSVGEPFVYPREDLSYAENFLYMMFSKPSATYVPDPVKVKAMETFLILHADHEQNASTSTVRIAGSSRANPFACIASGISALWGPLHGGANEAVIKMLEDIGDVKNIPNFLQRVKNKDDSVRLMGFGHRVYKNFDPRSKKIKEIVDLLLQRLGTDDPLFPIAKELERVALSDEYFIKRKLYPNVDFYSGIMLRAMGIPTSMYTVLFAVGRTVGWISQWKEMIEDAQQKIGRPRQLYIGHASRKLP